MMQGASSKSRLRDGNVYNDFINNTRIIFSSCLPQDVPLTLSLLCLLFTAPSPLSSYAFLSLSFPSLLRSIYLSLSISLFPPLTFSFFPRFLLNLSCSFAWFSGQIYIYYILMLLSSLKFNLICYSFYFTFSAILLYLFLLTLFTFRFFLLVFLYFKCSFSCIWIFIFFLL